MKGEAKGLGYLDMVTVFSKEKTMRQVETVSDFGIPGIDGRKISGYEVHMGKTVRPSGHSSGNAADVLGTYIHGIFDEDEFRETFITCLYERKGTKRDPAATAKRLSYRAFRENQIDWFAALLREHLDIPAIYKIMGLEK